MTEHEELIELRKACQLFEMQYKAALDLEQAILVIEEFFRIINKK